MKNSEKKDGRLLKNARKKLNTLEKILCRMGSVVIAFSGGVDSSFLLKTAKHILGDSVIAVTGDSEVFPSRELNESRRVARFLCAGHRIVKTRELENKNFAANPPDRCYYCKKELFSSLKKIAAQRKIAFIADGLNTDDLKDFRPGTIAAKEFGVRHPLQEAGLTKKDIRLLSRTMGLPTWNKPSFACLAGRFPYGRMLNREGIRRVNRAEEFLMKKGVSQCRIRVYGELIRIEVEPADFSLFLKDKERNCIVKYLKKLGYTYVTLDLQGYRTGSMNEILGKEITGAATRN
ncbi:MAG: ATP-dependent sacrificial sulfur transferase LarE [Candidatus Omnitrophica bacterium]|nr:ATP-dependent sacrificial sulfur transferase LarE [Candidatus Omnitrophota bacterium]